MDQIKRLNETIATLQQELEELADGMVDTIIADNRSGVGTPRVVRADEAEGGQR